MAKIMYGCCLRNSSTNTAYENHLVTTDPDFREIASHFRQADPEQAIGFNRYPFDRPYQSEGFRDIELAFAVAFHRASQLWEDGFICHGPSP